MKNAKRYSAVGYALHTILAFADHHDSKDHHGSKRVRNACGSLKILSSVVRIQLKTTPRFVMKSALI